MLRCVAAIVLAAGRGVRLGGPKALLLVRGDAGPLPLVEAQCRDRLRADCERALAVVRADVADLVGDRLRAAGAEVVVSRAPDELGPAGSLAAAAAYLEREAIRAAVVTPVDVRVEASTVAALIEALIEAGPPPLAAAPRFVDVDTAPSPLAASPRFIDTDTAPLPLAVVPRFGGRRGQPVVLAGAALARYREGDPPTLRDHLRSLGDRVAEVDVADPRVREDLDFADQTDLLLRVAGTRTPEFFR